MQNDPHNNLGASETPQEIKAFHAFMMDGLRRSGLLDDLRKAGLTDDSELKTKQESGAGAVPLQNNNLATNVKSVPQADR
jgi:hypothetical protein